MKFRYIITSILWIVGLLYSCKQDLPDTSKSIFETTSTPKNDFDKWLLKNFVSPYNIDYKYRMENIEADLSKNLTPAELKKSMQLAKIIKHAWLEAYVEAAGIDFMRKHAPAILHIIGSASWNEGGTITLGTAEGGLKITLYMANWLNSNNVLEMNEYFFKTMHHEFTHILQQDINYPQEYNLISASDYRPSGWQNRRDLAKYASLGFITSYAGSKAVEDITEITCCYITYTDEQWNRVFNAAGEAGRAKLNKKVAIMKKYMKETWNINMDKLRRVVARRMNEVMKMQLIEPSWIPLVQNNNENVNKAAMSIIKKELRSEWNEVLKKIDATPNYCHIHNANLMNFLNAQK